MGTPEKYNLLLLASYLVGLIGGILFAAEFGVFLGIGYFFIVLIFSVFFSIPVFALVNFLFNTFYAKIQPKIEIYAMLSPFVITFLWLIIEFYFHRAAFDSAAFYDRMKLVLVCSSISAFVFLVGNYFIKPR